MNDAKGQSQVLAPNGAPRADFASQDLQRSAGARAGPWIAAGVVYLAYALAVLFPVWSRSVDPIWDARDYFLPSFAFLTDALREGTLPLWDPYTNCGLPFHADPQAPLLNPVALLLAAVVRDPNTGFALYWTFHWAWAGLGMFVLAAALGASPVGGFVAAVSFSMSGFFVGHSEHTPYIVTASWLPWVVGLAHRAVSRRDARMAVLSGVALGLSALGGYPGLVAYSAFFLASWLGLAFLARRGDSGDPLPRRIGWVVWVLAITGALLAIIWAPVLNGFLSDAREYTSRTGPLSIGEATLSHPFSFRAALSLVFPKLVLQARDWFPADISMNDAYLGVLAIPLAMTWVAGKPKERLWIVALAALSFAVALGGEAGLRTALYHLLPPTRYMRHNAAFRLYFVLPLAAAAGLGASEVIHSAKARRALQRFLSGWLAATCIAAVPVGLMLLQRGLPGRSVLGALLPSLGVCLGALVSLAVAERWSGHATRIAAAGLALLVPVDLAWHVGKNSAVSWTPLDPLLARLASAPHAPDPAGRREVEPFGPWSNLHQFVHVPVVEGYVTMRSTEFNGGLVLGRFRDVLQAHRYWLSPSSVLAPRPESGVPALSRLGNSDRIPVFVGDPADVLSGEPVVPGTFGRVRISEYSRERIQLTVNVPGRREAILASTERYAPGWRARVDGKPVRVARVGYVFRGVRLPPGSHVVELEYSPSRFWPLVATSLGTVVFALVGVGFAILRSARRRQRNAGSPPSSTTLRGW